MSYLDKYEFMVKEAGVSLLVLFFLFFLFSILNFYTLAIIVAFSFLLVLYFYRNPDFDLSDDEMSIVSPLTGKVIDIYKEDGKYVLEVDKGFASIGYLRAPYKSNMKELSHIYSNGADLPNFLETSKVSFKNIGMEIELQGINFSPSIFIFIKKGILEKGRIFGFFKIGYAKIKISDKYKLEVQSRDFLESGRSILVRI